MREYIGKIEIISFFSLSLLNNFLFNPVLVFACELKGKKSINWF